MKNVTVRWPVRERPSRPHRHAAKYTWVDDDADPPIWRCEYRGCTWTRPVEDWEPCEWWGHDLVRSIVPKLAPLVCSRCGALACEIRPRLRVVA